MTELTPEENDLLEEGYLTCIETEWGFMLVARKSSEAVDNTCPDQNV